MDDHYDQIVYAVRFGEVFTLEKLRLSPLTARAVVEGRKMAVDDATWRERHRRGPELESDDFSTVAFQEYGVMVP